MKKALALVLALVLALSMAVSAFAEVIVLEPVPADEDEIEVITVVPGTDDWFFYTHTDLSSLAEGKVGLGTEYYVSLGDHELKDIKLTANGNITAELVEFDPDKMILTGAKTLSYKILVNGEVPTAPIMFDKAVEVELDFFGGVKTSIDGVADFTAHTYADACVLAKLIKNQLQVKDTVKVVCEQPYVNIVKITVANNFSAAYTEGTLKVEAFDNTIKKNVADKITIINDVAIFEYEQVKWAAENNAKGAALQLGAAGYSDFLAAEEGYSFAGEKYDPENLRNEDLDALVVSTTAFRAIEGKDLTLNIAPVDEIADRDVELSVTLKEVAKGQKGVNFFAWAEIKDIELDPDEDEDFDRYPSAVSFGFMGEQIIKGKYEVDVLLPINYYELREMFGIKVEEDDIISYYVVNQNNKVVAQMNVDYMTADVTEQVEFVIAGENEKLGWYTLCLEVPSTEVEGEENPNTGAESVVGVVAALAVVSLASAAAVSLKK